ncbi:MAG TPA: cation diffusion facilitator family transporter [Spirochaetota bacterium]|nr:cation diffusion facilitator family transporter [Spirochaetota bacterium]HPJ35239.1 cation diffusion facilitator family transporter [Spirochaetota bacterium]
MNRDVNHSPVKYVWMSIAASVATIFLKGGAYFLTGSVGLFSDALESFINLAAAVMALICITIAVSPPDREHPFGHNKAEYFSSVLEGTLILIAAVAIGVTAIERIINPGELRELGTGLVISAFASSINFFTSLVLMRAGKKYNSITLEADAHHLMTDVWTTAGVIAGLFLVKITGWLILDPVIAILVALNIVFTGVKLIKRSVSGLMDEALPEEELDRIKMILDRYEGEGLSYHSLYTRKAASKKFIFLHLLVPGNWHIKRGHEVTKRIEGEIGAVFSDADVFIHLEPLNDPDAFDDYLE